MLLGPVEFLFGVAKRLGLALRAYDHVSEGRLLAAFILDERGFRTFPPLQRRQCLVRSHHERAETAWRLLLQRLLGHFLVLDLVLERTSVILVLRPLFRNAASRVELLAHVLELHLQPRRQPEHTDRHLWPI